MALKTDYKDEVLSSSQPYRTYNIVDSGGSTLYSGVRINRADTPQQEGTKFGASDINSTNTQVNKNTTDIETANTELNKCLKQFTHSREEQWTGEYWIDGKKIYTKTIQSGLKSYKNGVPHDVSNMGSYRTFDFNNSFWEIGNGEIYPIGTYEANTAYISPKKVTPTSVFLNIGSSWESTSTSVYITIRYTKTTD